MENKKTNRNAQLTMGILVFLYAGVIYAWSVLKSPLKELGYSISDLSNCFTVTLIAFCLGGLVSGLVSSKISSKIRLIIAAVMCFAGFFIASKVTGSVVMLFLSYGVLAGGGIGIVYNTVISIVGQWFPDKKGFSSGLLMMAFGLSSFIFGKVCASLFTSNMGWQTTYVLLGAALAVMVLISAFVMKAPEKAKDSVIADAENDVPTGKMVKTAVFWKLFVFFTLLAAVGSCAIGLGKDYFTALNISEATAVTLTGVISIMNALGRIFSGWFFDKKGKRTTQLLTSVVAIVAPLCAMLGIITGIKALGAAGLLLCGFSYGFSPTVSAAFTMEFFGKKYFHLNFPVLNIVLIPAAFMSSFAGGLLTSGAGFTGVLAILTGLSVIGLIINLTIKTKG